MAKIYKNGAPDIRPATKKRSELELVAQSALFRMSSGMEVLLRKFPLYAGDQFSFTPVLMCM
jgi:hypothetical protein